MKGYGVRYDGNDHSSRIGKFEGGVEFILAPIRLSGYHRSASSVLHPILLLSGLSDASIYVANDVIIRRALQKNSEKFIFIGSLGFHQIEQSISHKVDSIMKNVVQNIDMSETSVNLREELAEYPAKVIQETEREKKR
jgi:hypothetical protein